MTRREIHQMFIRPDGQMECIYIDGIQRLIPQAQTVKISRASNVETNTNNQWVADMSPLQLPDSPPFDRREEALAWEVDVINALLRTGGNS